MGLMLCVGVGAGSGSLILFLLLVSGHSILHKRKSYKQGVKISLVVLLNFFIF